MPQLGEIKRGREINPSWGGSSRWIWQACLDCETERWVRMRNGKPNNKRCRACANKTRAGCHLSPEHRRKISQANTGKLKTGGKYKLESGYIMVRVPKTDFFYSMARKNGYVLEHRLVVAKALNRCLLPWETIHHKEGHGRDDNRYPESLELLPSPHRHDALTRMSNYIRKLEKRIVELESANRN